MGNNDPRRASVQDQDSNYLQLNQTNGVARLGLKPTNGQDAYKRSSSRSFRRSRSERTSYLMATGHLDLEESRKLNETTEPTGESRNSTPHNTMINVETTPSSSSKRAPISSSDLLISENLTPSYFDLNDNIFAHNNFKTKSKTPTKSLNKSKNANRAKFRQTYTEVNLPMKTSPAFEYILKDNRRRNRRCCLWFLYSILITVCMAIIIFCCTHLVSRYYHN